MSDTFARYIVGNSLDVLRSLPDASVDLVLTSPPFLGLRSYLPPDDPSKPLEMGSEGTPGEFIDALLDIVEECRRVLAPHGSICFELGDTYAGSGGAGGDYNAGGLRDGQERFDGSKSRAYGTGAAPRPPRDRWRSPGADPKYKQRGEQSMGTGAGGDWPLDKSLCLIPESFRWALVYGRNPFTGRETPRWRARNVVRWCRPNPPVGALADKVRPATSDMVIACVGRARYFDLDAIRTPPEDVKDQRRRNTNGPKQDADPSEVLTANYHQRVPSNVNGAPPLDHWWYDEDDTFDQDAWNIPTQPYAGSHYATWPEALCARPIDAMCPHRVCTECGKPSTRVTEPTPEYREHLDEKLGRQLAPVGERLNRIDGGRMNAEVLTTGWTDCGHDSWRAGVVLDPFAGSGTTLAVAFGHGRSAIGIDLDNRNAELARDRVGMWLTVEEPVVWAKRTVDVAVGDVL